MKLIIAGSRTLIATKYCMRDILDNFGLEPENPDIVTEIVSGTAAGIDQAGEHFAKQYTIPVKKFPADWDKHGKAAGPIRNAEMAKYADALLLIWDGSSRGSANMKQNMEKLGKPVYEVIIKVPKIIVEDEL